MSHLNEDCLRIIFTELQHDSLSLHSCILVNRLWCRIAASILWKDPRKFNMSPPYRCKLYIAITYLLPTSSKKLLIDNNIILPSTTYSNQPFFNYISFFSEIPTYYIDEMVRVIIREDENYIANYWATTMDEILPPKAKRDQYSSSTSGSSSKKNLVEQEVNKLFINNCKNIKDFHWMSEQPLSQYPGATTCFSQIHTLKIFIKHVTSPVLFEMAHICQNIEDLDILSCNEDVPGLIRLIDVQKNLQSLYLDFYKVKKQCIQLSEVIERKAVTLKKLKIGPDITLLSPKFLPSLINIQYLELNDDEEDDLSVDKEGVEMQEWKEYLSISSFPNLQRLNLPFCKEYALIEKTNGNIIDIKIIHCSKMLYKIIYHYRKKDFEKLTKMIARHCPKLESLKICAELEHLEDIKEILLNCMHLKSIELVTHNEEWLICDKLLEILVNFSSKKLYIISLHQRWIFTDEGLRNFFENWRNRIPMIFTCRVDKNPLAKGKEQAMILKKYHDEGVIKNTIRLWPASSNN